MRQVEELTDTLTEQLESQFRTSGMIGNMPRVPMMVLYAGRFASRAENDISNTLRQVWRKRGEAVCHLMMDSEGFYKIPEEDGPSEKLDIHEFQQKIDELYEKESSFRDMNDFFLSLVFDTRDYEDLEAFKINYEKIDNIKEDLGQPYCLTMAVIMLDESASRNKLSSGIKLYLREKMENKECQYRSNVILSNKLYNGTLLRGERRKENFNLAGTILLLANSIGGDYSPPVSILFPSGQNAYYLTAAYSKVRRPNRKICEIILHTVMNWLEDKVTEGNELSLDELCRRLEITGGTSRVFSEYFDRKIKVKLPPEETLEFFPRISKGAESLAAMPFASFNHETMGMASLFYSSEFRTCIENLESDFYSYIQTIISNKINAGEAKASLSDVMIDKILSQIRNVPPSEGSPAYEYLTEKTRMDYVEKVLPLFKNQMQELRERSKSSIRQLSDVIQEFQEGFFIDSEDENLKHYYEELTEHFLESADKHEIITRLSMEDDDKEIILQLLKDLVLHIVTEHSVFAMPLVEEMTVRMGQNPTVIQQILQNELMNEISDKVRLRTLTAMNMLQEIFVVNQRDENGENTTFFNYLKQLKEGQTNVSFFESGNSNSIEVIRLYQCDVASLI